jgi:hypothetical protein
MASPFPQVKRLLRFEKAIQIVGGGTFNGRTGNEYTKYYYRIQLPLQMLTQDWYCQFSGGGHTHVVLLRSYVSEACDDVEQRRLTLRRN